MQKGKVLYGVLFGILMVLLFVPIIQEYTGVFPVRSLAGVFVKTEKPQLTLDSYASGKFQGQTERYVSENFGLREPVIRLYNQYVWDFYRKTYVKTIIPGKEKWLYGKEFIDDLEGIRWKEYANSPSELRSKFVKEADRLRKVQEILAEYDKHLFVIMEPGKARTYPEYLPDAVGRRIAAKETDELISAADMYPAILDSVGVNYVNIDRWFQRDKEKFGFSLYPQTGTHWSNLAALHATDSIIRYMEQIGNRDIANLKISSIVYDTTMNPDADFENLLNVNRVVRDVPNQYANFELLSDTNTVKPAWIHIGDSYYWNISYHIPLDEIFSRHPYWYYNSTIYYDAKYHSTAETDIVAELVNADFVTLGYCTSQIYTMSSYFAAKALVNLCYDKKDIKKVVMDIVESMNNIPEWKAALQQKADSQGKPVEEVMMADAYYVLYLDPEKYFPELNESHPISRNGMLRMCVSDDPVGRILRNMYGNDEWLESIHQKAKQQKVELETMMLRDAEWMLNNQ